MSIVSFFCLGSTLGWYWAWQETYEHPGYWALLWAEKAYPLGDSVFHSQLILKFHSTKFPA